jgi:hypothetical protein
MTAIPEGRLWYYSDDEETWFGNCASREDAVDEGRDAHPDRAFTICEARAIPKDPDEDPEDWLYALVDMRHEETFEPLEGEAS